MISSLSLIISKKTDKIVFCDTDLLTTATYSKLYFNNYCDPLLDKYSKLNYYDLYLLMDIDIPWVKDDLRDRISAFYGVSKVFMADNTTSGGLNNEGMQILVTNRAVQKAQTVYNNYVFPFLVKQFGITDWNLKLPPSEEEDEIAVLRKREIEVNIAASTKNLGFEVDMDEDGQFTFKKPEPEASPEGQAEGGEKAETDPYAGTNIDASQMGQMQEQALQGGSKPQENPATTRNKPSMSVAPDKRMSGLPLDAGNQNNDRRTERRVG